MLITQGLGTGTAIPTYGYGAFAISITPKDFIDFIVYIESETNVSVTIKQINPDVIYIDRTNSNDVTINQDYDDYSYIKREFDEILEN